MPMAASLSINHQPLFLRHGLLGHRYSSQHMVPTSLLKPNIPLLRISGGSSSGNNNRISSSSSGGRMFGTSAVSSGSSSTETDNDVGLGGSSLVLKKGIAEFYDESSGIWEDIWGDHMHHGFYDGDSPASLSDHRLAQIRMIDEALRFASVPSGQARSFT